MSGFAVDLVALEEMQRGLRGSADRLRTVSGRLAGASAQELGGRDLDAACGQFASEWEYGLGRLSELAGGIADRVEAALRVYRDNDEAVRAAMRGQ